MKKVLLLCAVLALALPATAGITDPMPAGTITDLTGSRATPIYADLTQSGYFLDNGSASTYPLPVADDIHAISGGTITSFTIGYTCAGTGTFALPVAFYTNNAADTVVPGAGAALITSFTIPGLPVGGYIVGITGVSIPVGADFWFEQSYNGVATGGPLITGNPGGTVGYSHDIFAQTGATWYFTSGTWADFVLGFNIVPEPASISLLALAGLGLLLRRR